MFACPNQNGVWNLIERTWTLECWVFWVSHILAISALNFIYNTEVVINPVTVAPSVISFSIPVFFFCLKDFLFSFFNFILLTSVLGLISIRLSQLGKVEYREWLLLIVPLSGEHFFGGGISWVLLLAERGSFP